MTDASWAALAAPGLALAVLAAAGGVRAQEDDGAEVRVTAHVVRIDGDDLFLDVGGEDARRGLELDVYRRIEVRHPISGQRLRDRFTIGKVRIVQPGETLSIARVVGTPHWTVEVGDAVETEAAAPTPARPAPVAAQCPPCAESVVDPRDPATAELIAVWRSTIGRPPSERASLYHVYLQRNPGSPYAEAVRREISALSALEAAAAAPSPEDQRARAEELRRARARTAAAAAVSMEPLEGAREGEPVVLGASVEPGEGVRAVMLYVRHDEAVDPSYRQVRMTLDAHGHARATVPPDVVAPPGFHYFVEVVEPGGEAIPVSGSGTQPRHVVVSPAVRDGAGPPSGRSRVRLSSELVSFNGFEGNDWYLITEGDFLYRTLFAALYGVRVGYGHVTGEGGTVEELDELGLEPQPAGFTYGYLEAEIRVSEMFALMTRATVGLGQAEGFQDGLRGGFQLRVRIGEERGTNLVVAGETIPELGQRAFLGLSWEAIEDWPMTAEVHVTDQPVDSDELGVRGVFETGYRMTDQVAVAARVSYQGRTIDHAGLGAGLAATFDW